MDRRQEISSRMDNADFVISESRHKIVELPLNVDHELRKALIDLCEKKALEIIDEICTDELPTVSYQVTNIESLTEQMESLDESYKNESVEDRNDDGSLSPKRPKFTQKFKKIHLGSVKTRRNFALFVLTIAKAYDLLCENRTQTRRSFYYELKNNVHCAEVINGQNSVDRMANNVASVLKCNPYEIGLLPSAKGLAAGSLLLHCGQTESIDFRVVTLISHRLLDNVTSIESHANFILVVEKDAVFDKLVEDNFPEQSNCVLITGKGFPDVATRRLVKLLADKLELPVYVLSDANPGGIEILFTYKYGSMALSYNSESLACPAACWIGLRPSDFRFRSLKIAPIPLTKTDQSKINSLKIRPYMTAEVLRELEIMMRRGKADIEAIGPLISFYATAKIKKNFYI